MPDAARFEVMGEGDLEGIFSEVIYGQLIRDFEGLEWRYVTIVTVPVEDASTGAVLVQTPDQPHYEAQFGPEVFNGRIVVPE